jgi:hypothetical protein
MHHRRITATAVTGIAAVLLTLGLMVGPAAYAGTAAGAPSMSAAPAGWTIQPTPQPANGGSLYGIACPTSTRCVAVGSAGSPHTGVSTLAETWNGTAWTLRSTPNVTGAIFDQLSDVACPTTSHCVAAGYTIDSAGNGSPLIEVWNGTTWNIQPAPIPAGGVDAGLTGVACPSVKMCVAVGNDGNKAGALLSFTDTWNGTRWTAHLLPLPKPATRGGYPVHVTCPSVTSCVAIGHWMAQHTGGGFADVWNGTRWSTQMLPNPTGTDGYPSGIACRSRTDCMTVGQTVGPGPMEKPYAATWNGSHWTVRSTPGPSTGGGLSAVACPTASVCTAVGYRFNQSQAESILAERWNGSHWTVQSAPTPAGDTGALAAIGCPSVHVCTAVGTVVTSALIPVALAEHWQG